MGPEEKNAAPALGPVAPRPYWLVLFSVVIRALHQVGAAVYLSSFLLDGFLIGWNPFISAYRYYIVFFGCFVVDAVH